MNINLLFGYLKLDNKYGNVNVNTLSLTILKLVISWPVTFGWLREKPLTVITGDVYILGLLDDNNTPITLLKFSP